MARLRKVPHTKANDADAPQNYVRFRISPEMTIVLAVSITSV